MNTQHKRRPLVTWLGLACALAATPMAHATAVFNVGDLVVSIYGNGNLSGSYGDNQASPIVLQALSTTGVLGNALTLPQSSFVSASGVLNSAISGEYGSSSEGTLQLSGDGKLLTIMGYGVNAAAFNSATVNATNAYGTQALAQTTSVQGGNYTAVSRVVATISAAGTVNTSTAIYNFANTNNPRSVATQDGSSFYVAGQGVKGDSTQGLQYVVAGSSSGTVINAGTDMRTASFVNGQLYVSSDSKQTGATGTSKGSANIAVYGATAPTSATTPTVLAGVSNSVVLTAGKGNGINATATANLSPENFFFANATTLYVADAGQPKQGGLGDGGLQKWTLTGNTWVLDYTLSNGLALVANTAKAGTTGLIGLTGKVDGNTVSLFATNATLGDLDPTYLYSINDTLSATTLPTSESFSVLMTAAANTNIRGVSFAPSAAVSAVPEPASYALFAAGLGALGFTVRRKRTGSAH
ncbi:PEP-CTERM sorting domain-containing protein [Roseateles koreensis]|uniref:PEP-CTERM sorting domain-containing protein n=1 Tax=Roseateles koreensis TaxID=2987526 RepID=A0ABT5KPA1_9BURK|nr:PEP-CTERM sorting domain-containing protein [Roseateles koreensis]MDC8784681.1 PEP-CTERM sorting domain-containing protein [Roseateles koreensis]